MTNTELVMGFIQAWNDMDWDAVIGVLAEDVVYHNIPMDVIEGRDAAAGFIRGMAPESVDWEVLNIAENGNVVLTERVDNFVMASGARVSLPVMGTMEIENGKIKAWRDYFDLATFATQMGG
jgi:limonene-1,2-epoxide hydrolase